ncbi:MAG TPA: hypothetical protein VG942_10605 [Hyphomonadaceae bacterium]|nr:hypothetical protein [Hyphomonadaceae bacterium]
MTGWRFAIALALLALPACASAGLYSPGDLLIHSDLPFWSDSSGSYVTPHPIEGIGCDGDFRLGVWKESIFREDGGAPDLRWWRVHNYGSFHCAAVFNVSDERDGSYGDRKGFGFVIALGRDKATGLDLFVWQMGMIPGSEYRFLAAPAGGDGTRYTVLQADCSAGTLRSSHVGGSFITTYCSLASEAAVRATARAAAKRPPKALLRYVDDNAPDPDEDE